MDAEEVHKSVLENARLTFARSGGKGGQNVNKVNTKVHASIDISKIRGLGEKEFLQMLSRLKPRMNSEGEIFTDAEDSRRQELNRKIALERLEQKILGAAKIRRKRIKTKPTAASRERRLRSKKLKSQIKRERGWRGD